ncbi:MAG: OmpH family outer membrane protein [Bacteroidaceae bacterium]|nr:OmpH family outer membrane protein [Bacteroidaceae bacterium]
MKVRLLLAAVLTNAFLMVSAQEGKFGYIDFNSTLMLMPEYLEAEINLQKIQSDYKEEIERSKREFERVYIEFMLEQDQLSASIVAKRQRELQLLMDNNAQFRDKVQSDLEAKRAELLYPIRNKLLKTVSDVCSSLNLDYVIDTGKGTYLFINPEKGVDISTQVYKLLGIDNQTEQIVEGEKPVIVSSDK